MSENQDRYKIVPYDATQYLRQMKYLPDMTPLIAILLVLVIIFFFATYTGGGNSIYAPEAKYSHPEPSGDVLPNIFITRFGEIYLNSMQIETNHFSEAIMDCMSKMKCKDAKVLLTGDERASWGKIVDIMELLKQSKIQFIGLITDKHFSVLDYSQQKQLYQEKGLRLPESAR